MLQAIARRILFLGMTRDSWETTGDPNRKDDHRGARSRDLASRQGMASGRPLQMGRPTSSQTSRQDGKPGRTGLEAMRI